MKTAIDYCDEGTGFEVKTNLRLLELAFLALRDNTNPSLSTYCCKFSGGEALNRLLIHVSKLSNAQCLFTDVHFICLGRD